MMNSLAPSIPRRVFAGLALACALSALPAAAAPPPAVPILAAAQLAPGMKARVRTVFAGERVEEFEAEIVGVLTGGGAEGDQILARATSENAIRSGIAQGMSGSPVYVDGKLIGALSGGWSFVREPIFVITPITEMLSVLEYPETAGGGTAGPAGVERAAPRFGPFAWPGDEAPGIAVPPAVRPLTGAPVPLTWPLACSGLHPAAQRMVADLFAPHGLAPVPGAAAPAVRGAAPPGAGGAAIEPGSSVAIDVLRGDLNLSAIGTVTYRDGDRLLIAGHPLFQSGEVRLPLSTAAITTIIPSEASSFKLGRTGVPIGTVTQDRRAALAGRLGASPRLLPVTVTVVEEGRETVRRFESIEDRSMMPTLVGTAAINSLMESGGAAGNQTLRWTLRLVRTGGRTLTLSDVIAGESPPGEAAAAVATPLRFLANNPYERLALDSVSVRLELAPGRRQWALRSVRLLSATVRPGARAQVRCEIEAWHGERRHLDIGIEVPGEVPEGRYVLFVGGGAELSRLEAARLPGRFRPVSLDDAFERFGALRTNDALYVVLVARAPEITRSGADYPELPMSALALLASGQAGGDDLRRGDRALLSEIRTAVPGMVRGEVQLELTVDPRTP